MKGSYKNILKKKFKLVFLLENQMKSRKQLIFLWLFKQIGSVPTKIISSKKSPLKQNREEKK